MSKFCQACGNEINDDALFCKHCGVKQQADIVESEPQREQEVIKVPTPKKSMQKRKKLICAGIGLLIIVLSFVLIVTRNKNTSTAPSDDSTPSKSSEITKKEESTPSEIEPVRQRVQGELTAEDEARLKKEFDNIIIAIKSDKNYSDFLAIESIINNLQYDDDEEFISNFEALVFYESKYVTEGNLSFVFSGVKSSTKTLKGFKDTFKIPLFRTEYKLYFFERIIVPLLLKNTVIDPGLPFNNQELKTAIRHLGYAIPPEPTEFYYISEFRRPYPPPFTHEPPGYFSMRSFTDSHGNLRDVRNYTVYHFADLPKDDKGGNIYFYEFDAKVYPSQFAELMLEAFRNFDVKNDPVFALAFNYNGNLNKLEKFFKTVTKEYIMEKLYCRENSGGNSRESLRISGFGLDDNALLEFSISDSFPLVLEMNFHSNGFWKSDIDVLLHMLYPAFFNSEEIEFTEYQYYSPSTIKSIQSLKDVSIDIDEFLKENVSEAQSLGQETVQSSENASSPSNDMNWLLGDWYFGFNEHFAQSKLTFSKSGESIYIAIDAICDEMPMKLDKTECRVKGDSLEFDVNKDNSSTGDKGTGYIKCENGNKNITVGFDIVQSAELPTFYAIENGWYNKLEPLHTGKQEQTVLEDLLPQENISESASTFITDMVVRDGKKYMVFDYVQLKYWEDEEAGGYEINNTNTKLRAFEVADDCEFYFPKSSGIFDAASNKNSTTLFEELSRRYNKTIFGRSFVFDIQIKNSKVIRCELNLDVAFSY